MKNIFQAEVKESKVEYEKLQLQMMKIEEVSRKRVRNDDGGCDDDYDMIVMMNSDDNG